MAFITAQRLAELVLAHRNTRRLVAAGGVEAGRAHYPLIVALHAAWLGGLWLLARDHAVNAIFFAAFVALQLARAWVIASLGRRWTTRIIAMPGEPLVARGPYRFMRHPNYAVVAAEIAIVPLALGEPLYAGVFFVLNALVLAVRIRTEDAVLAAAATGALPAEGQGMIGSK